MRLCSSRTACGRMQTVEGQDVEMKKTGKPSILRYISIAAVIFLISLLASALTRVFLTGDVHLFPLKESQAALVTSMIEGAVGAIAAGFVLYEMKINANVEARQSDIEEAQFLLEYNQAFIQDEKMCEVEHRLEQWMEGTLKDPLINEENRQRFINYLVYLEGLAPLIFRNILTLEHIDDLMAYRFFLATNNPVLQEDQLFRYAEYYRGCFKLYTIWKSYRTKNGHATPLSQYALDRWPEFEKYCDFPVVVKTLDQKSDRKKTAELIYGTDPYIYPTAFGDCKRATKLLPSLMDEACLFNANNLRVAEIDGKPVGIALVVDASSQLAPPPALKGLSGKAFKDVRERYFATVSDAVASIENSAHLLCLSVDSCQHGKRIGTALLKNVIQECMEKGLSAISLDVLADNSVAIRLYENYGFRCESDGPGYAYGAKAPPCYRMVLRFVNTEYEGIKTTPTR